MRYESRALDKVSFLGNKKGSEVLSEICCGISPVFYREIMPWALKRKVLL